MKYLKKFEKSRQDDINDILTLSDVFDIDDGKSLLKEIKELINSDSDVNSVDHNFRTPLINSSIYKCKYTENHSINHNCIYAEIVKLLIKSGADVNMIDYNSASALIWAADRGNFEVMYTLIDANADWNFVDDYGKDFIEYLPKSILSNIIKKYPDKYNEYLTKKETFKYNL